MVSLAKETRTTQPAFDFFIKMKMVIFVFIVVVAACACFDVAQDGVSQLCGLSIECPARDAWHKCHMDVFFIVLHEFFIMCFVVVLDVLVAGDLRHEYAQST